MLYMPTTTQITNIAAKLDLTAYAGDFADDFDMDAVHAEYVDALAADLPDGITLCRNGDVLAELNAADQAREFDWDDFLADHPAAYIFERHDLTDPVVAAGRKLAESRATTAAALESVRVAVYADHRARGTGPSELARRAGVDRMTVLKWLGKR